jgi:pimeloyl-ACP methyl ester carboxylesterase
MAASFRGAFLRVGDGLNIHYRDYPGAGDRPPILCLSGLTRNARDFAEFGERYSPAFRVIALDYRGRGASDPDPVPGRYVPPTYAKDVIELLDALGIARAIFVGTSLGGLVAMTVAAIAPDRIAGTILNDIGPELELTGLERIRNYVGKDVRFISWEAAAAAIAANNLHIPESYGNADWLKAARRNCREENGEIRFDYDPAIAVPFEAAAAAPAVDLWPFFRVLASKPLLVVRGERSDLLSAAALDRMREAASTASFVTVPGVGHTPMLDEPEAVAAIDAFLGRFAA